MNDFENYFNSICNQTKEAYYEIASTFYTYAGPTIPRELIDQAIFFRLGLIDSAPRSNDESVNSTLENLIYSAHTTLPHRLFNRISECIHKAFPKTSQHNIRSALLHSFKHPPERYRRSMLQ